MSEMTKAPIKDYKDLLVWQKGVGLAKEIYIFTRSFPAEEKFGLISQMRRAAVSVPSNIAEGQARNTTGEFIQFLAIAQGSLAELDTQVRISNDLGLCSPNQSGQTMTRITELQKMLRALRARLALSNH